MWKRRRKEKSLRTEGRSVFEEKEKFTHLCEEEFILMFSLGSLTFSARLERFILETESLGGKVISVGCRSIVCCMLRSVLIQRFFKYFSFSNVISTGVLV